MNKDQKHINNFDSIRGIAALLVVLSHIPNIDQPSLGATGVWIFFVLSGFLLYQFFENRTFQNTLQVIPNYFWRRFFRLIPTYYVCLFGYFIVYSVMYDSIVLGWLFKHITLQEASGHFWSIKIELIFYLLLPVFIVFFNFIKVESVKILACLLSVFIVYFLFEYKKILTVKAASIMMAPYLSPFFLGIFLSMIRDKLPNNFYQYFFYAGCIGITLLSFDFIWFIDLRSLMPLEHLDNIGWRYPGLIYPFAGLLVIGAYRTSSVVLSNKLLIHLGVVSYSFYLWHIVFINVAKIFFENSIPILALTLVGSGTLAQLTYIFVEKKSVAFYRKYQLIVERV